MSETVKNEKAPKKSFFKGVKAEFNKIIWPNQNKVTKQTIAVIAVSVVLAAIIAALDFVFQFGLSKIL